MSFFSSILGLDIGSWGIKGLVLRGGILSQASWVPLPEGAIQDGWIHDPEVVSAALSRLLKKNRWPFWGQKVALGLGGSSLILKRATFPSQPTSDLLAESIYYGAEQHLQRDVSSLYLDFHKLDAIAQASELQILLAASPKETADVYIQILENCKLKIGILDAAPFSMANAFTFNYGPMEGLCALINLGHQSTQISFMGNGQFYASKDLRLGGQLYTKTLSEKLSISLDEAETMKISSSFDQNPLSSAASRCLSEVNQHMALEIQKAIESFFKSPEALLQFNQISSIYLGGGGSYTLGLQAAVAAVQKIPVHIFNPFQNIPVDLKKQSKNFPYESHIYGVALGLAQRTLEKASPL